MKAVHIPRVGEELVFAGAVVVGPQVWADSARADGAAAENGDAVADAISRLSEVLERAGSSLPLIAKLDAYVASHELAERVTRAYESTFAVPRPVLQVQVADIWGPDPVVLDAVAAVSS